MKFLSVLFLVTMSVLTSCSSQPEDSRPNILLIFTDDQGMNDLSCYGSEIGTPHIDSIAEEGIRFDSWYVASSICTPSRYGMLTGQYPSRSKDRLLGPLMFLEDRDKTRGIQKGERTMAEALGSSGYETALIGKWHLGHGSKKMLPVSHGFETFKGHTGGCIDYFTMRYGIKQDWYNNTEHDDTVGYATDVITDEAVKFLETERDKPFFLFLSYNAPHFGKGWDVGRQQVINFMQAKDDDLKRVTEIKDPIRRQFAAMVKSLDDGVGRVMQALKDTGYDDNTLVIFMADNGGDYKYGGSNKPFRGAKASLFEGGIRVPCVMKFPGRIKPGSTTNAAVGAIDLFPTFCAMAGKSTKGYPLDGIDIMSVLKGEKTEVVREMLFELHKASAYRTDTWKYLKNEDEPAMLFNMKTDPYEKNDLSASKADVFRKMKARHDELLKSTAN